MICRSDTGSALVRHGVCDSCLSNYQMDSAVSCPVCGCRLPDSDFVTETGCLCCQDQTSGIAGVLSLSEYQCDPWLQNAVLSMKHRSQTQFSRALGYLLGQKAVKTFPGESWHGITAVPLHFTRRWKRGFNQAEIVASFMGRTLNIPSFPWLIRRIRRTPPQSGGPDKRRENVNGVFRAGGVCRGARLILVDDVYTTGATTRECAKILCQAGAKQVLIATCAWVRRRY